MSGIPIIKKRNLRIAAAIGFSFAVIGAMSLLASRAATPTVSVEAEGGALSGSALPVNDTAASQSKAIKFGVNPTPASVIWGTLGSRPERAAEESTNGVKMAMLELGWWNYEPKEGQYNQSYINDMKNRLNAYKSAGMQVTLGLGTHYTPDWIFQYPDSRFVNQHGQASSNANFVFNATVRQKAEKYFARIHQDLGLNNFYAIRVSSGGHAEVLYPDDSYWAYDRNAQNGSGLPASQQKNPFPGWKPGDRSISTTQVGQWADWYVRSLTDTVNWQIKVFNGLGYAGMYQPVTPGSGTRPTYYQQHINNYLPDGTTGVGAVWHKVYEYIQDKSRLIVYISSVADHSGNDDSCQDSDVSVEITSSTPNSWSATRWLTRIARQYNLPTAGENPGWNYPPTFNTWYRDTSDTGMMSTAIRQARTCKFTAFYWAHDDQLWDGTLPFVNYANKIK